MAERRSAHLRALRPGMQTPPGQLFWEYPTKARAMIARGDAELVLNLSDFRRETIPRIFRRYPDWPLNRLSFIEPAWTGKAAVILAGGPSLTQEQVGMVWAARGCDRIRVIAVNDAYLWAPWADVLYASDFSWWLDHAAGIAKPLIGLTAAQVRERFEAFPGARCSIQDSSGAAAADPRLHIIRNGATNAQGNGIHADGLSLEPDALLTGRNSGWQAINVAVLAGARPIILLGIDGRPGIGGRSHWSGGHREPTPQQAYQCYFHAFSVGGAALKNAGIQCFNASPGTAINAFPTADLSEMLAEYLQVA